MFVDRTLYKSVIKSKLTIQIRLVFIFRYDKMRREVSNFLKFNSPFIKTGRLKHSFTVFENREKVKRKNMPLILSYFVLAFTALSGNVIKCHKVFN